MAGWGLTQRRGPPARALQELDMHVLDARMCNNSRFWNGGITPHMICLKANSKNQAPCKVKGQQQGGRAAWPEGRVSACVQGLLGKPQFSLGPNSVHSLGNSGLALVHFSDTETKAQKS